LNSAAETTEPFPWRRIMSTGLGLLRLPPRAFWAMTPRELNAACHRPGAANSAPPARADLLRLMRDFPDEDVSECPTI
jgi:uncharacterized phage protein (TIGR02216 family)